MTQEIEIAQVEEVVEIVEIEGQEVIDPEWELNLHPLVPKRNPHYMAPLCKAKVEEAFKLKENILLVGKASTGKSSLAKQLAAENKRPVSQVNFNQDIAAYDLIGHYIIKEGETVFVDGVLPRAMKEGHVLLLEEIDTLPPGVGFVLQSLMEKGGKLFIPDTGTYVEPHKDFQIIGTSNTGGFGDASGLYIAGTHRLNHSHIDRWAFVFEITFFSASKEAALLEKRFPKVDKGKIELLCKGAEMLRKSALATPVTLRALISACMALNLKWSVKDAVIHCVVPKFPHDEREAVLETYQRLFAW